MEHRHDLAYRICVTEANRMLAKSFAEHFGGSYLRVKYSDLINDTKTVDENEQKVEASNIINRIKTKLKKIGGET